MDKDLRLKHLKFIQEDTKKRGETIVSDIVFIAAIYECKVKIEGRKSRKTVTYSGAVNPGKYRKIEVEP